MARSKVALVNMPFYETTQPSLALGLLKAEVTAVGIPVDVHYLNLLYEREAGPGVTASIEALPRTLLAGEWVFSQLLFPEQAYPRASAYFQLAEQELQDPLATRGTLSHLKTLLTSCFTAIEPFLRSVFEIDWGGYRVVGFSSTYQQHAASLALARFLKQAHPELLIIFGGANCESDMGAALLEAFPFVDAVCVGEGDLSFPEYCLQALGHTPPAPIPAILARGEARRYPAPQLPILGAPGEAPLVQHLDTLPYPDFDDYFAQLERWQPSRKPTIYLPFETSRGCWWGERRHCTFCGLNGASMAFRTKTPPRALAELQHLMERYGTRFEELAAVDNIMPVTYLKEFVPQLRAFGKPIFYELKSNLSEADVAALAEAGIRKVQPGIESLSTPVLERMRKGVDAIHNIQLLKYCAEYGIHPYWNLLVRFPGDQPSDYTSMLELLPAIVHLTPPHTGGISPVRFDRFSPYVSQPERFGIKNLRPFDVYSLLYPGLQPALVFRLAYHFWGDFANHPDLQPTLKLLHSSVQLWRLQHEDSALFQIEAGDLVVIGDFRPVAWQHVYIFSGWRAAIMRGCQRIRRQSDLFESIRNQPDSPGHREVERFLDAAEIARILWREGNRFLSLAVRLGRGYRLNADIARAFAALLDSNSPTSLTHAGANAD
jgi:ribosomal peptide maturation radical SAM protein 1